MRTQWNLLKNIINNSDQIEDRFLTLIDEEGAIVCANARMQRILHLKNPRQQPLNFFSLLHPGHVDTFKSALSGSKKNGVSDATELYLKNGYYHPMKWKVNYVAEELSGKEMYLCIGQRLLDDTRIQTFNQLGARNYQLIVEGLNTGILFQDTRGELIAANKKASEILDTSLETLYGLKEIYSHWDKNWTVTRESGERVLFRQTPFMKALYTGKPQSETLRITLRSGEKRWVQFNSQPLMDEIHGNDPFAVISNIIDVTNEKELTKEVQVNQTIINAFLANTPTLAWVVDEEGILVFASRSFCSYFNLDEENISGRQVFELLPAAVSQALKPKHFEVLENGEPIEIIEKVKWADGTNFIFHINLFAVNGHGGKRMVGGNAINLADKAEVEKRLNEANERLLLLNRATTDAIWEWDMQTGHIFRNDALMNMIGYHFENSKGLSWWLRSIHPEDRNRVTDKIKEATDKGQHSWEDKYRLKCADGEYKHIHDHGFVVYENGLPVKMIGSLQDISGMKMLEDKLLEEKLERQKEISETILRVQEKERTRIGHELHDNVNQILATTKLFLQMIKPEEEDQQLAKSKCIEYIGMAVEEIRKLSKELVVPQLRNEGLIESIKLLIDDFEITTPLKIRFTHDTDIDLLAANKKLTLFRIVQEQLKNIIRHSGARHVEIYMHRKELDTLLIIKDDGCGFDLKQTSRGIGLSNIHERSRFYDGTVEIITAPGEGCTVTVSIPFSK
jgi:PAS domain S-box-containing protein